jgi:aminoglycoside phosphotransferase (APT) family kinase protein
LKPALSDEDLRRFAGDAVRVGMGASPERLERMTTGLRNEVYAAKVGERDVVVRMNHDPAPLRGSAEHIPIFQKLRIPTPEILAANLTAQPLAWQIQTRLPGADIGKVIHGLSETQLDAIAAQIAGVFRKLEVLPSPGWFGWTSRRYPSWLPRMQRGVDEIAGRNAKSGVVGDDLIALLRRLVESRREAFADQAPIVHFDDLSSKNVMICEGTFTGLVDLDDLAGGDPLEAVGRIRASWWGAPYGDHYADRVQVHLGLNAEQRRSVDVYALYNRISWLSEQGVRFNANQPGDIDPLAVARDRAVIADMAARLSPDA